MLLAVKMWRGTYQLVLLIIFGAIIANCSTTQPQLENTLSEILKHFAKIARDMDTQVNINRRIEGKLTSLENDVNRKCSFWKRKLVGHRLIKLAKGDYYYHTSSSLTWKKARSYCQDHGMDLAILSSLKEMTDIGRQAPNSGHEYWVGATDIGRAPGQFFWTDGSRIDNDMWITTYNDPNDYGPGKETCVILNGGQRKFYDAPCDHNGGFHFLCEVPFDYLHCL